MKILVTGFDPFGGESVNPAYEAVKLLPDVIGGAEIFKLEILDSFFQIIQKFFIHPVTYIADSYICARSLSCFHHLHNKMRVSYSSSH